MSPKESDAIRRRAALDCQLPLDVLKAAPGRRFTASDLRRATVGKSGARPRGVPKTVVRRRLHGVPGVVVVEDSTGLWFSWSS